MKSRFTIIEFPVFSDYLVHVEFTSDIDKSCKKYKQIPDRDGVQDIDALAISIEAEPFSFIFLHHNASAGTIAHESWHVVQRMMRYMGIDIESEVVAYHLGYLVNQIISFRRKGK